MRRILTGNFAVAYPGILGDGLPEPPYGYMFIVDDAGSYITDDAGNFIVVEWVYG